MQRFQASAVARGNEHVISFEDPIRLKAIDGGPSGFHLAFDYTYDVIEMAHPRFSSRWQIFPRRYSYSFLDRDYRELLAYHWEPGLGYKGPDMPHIHISAALNAQVDAVTKRTIDLDKLHIVTGFVSIAAMIKMLITEFGVAPRRQDWESILNQADEQLRTATT